MDAGFYRTITDKRKRLESIWKDFLQLKTKRRHDKETDRRGILFIQSSSISPRQKTYKLRIIILERFSYRNENFESHMCVSLSWVSYTRKTSPQSICIARQQGNANQNHNEITLQTFQNGYHHNTKNNKCWPKCGGKGAFLHCWWECKLVQLLWKQYGSFRQK